MSVLARLRARWTDVRTGAARPVDAGSAIIEFVFVAVIVMVPMVYLVPPPWRWPSAPRSRSPRPRGTPAVPTPPATPAPRPPSGCGRPCGSRSPTRGCPTTPTSASVASGAGCDADPLTPVFAPGAEFTVCVTRRVDLPGVPSVLAGRGIRMTGEYLVHVDDFRAVGHD